MMRLINLVLITLLVPFIGIGQDLHFSQHYASPLHLNPAMTGVFDFDFKDKDLRLSSIYRQQWRTIRGPYVNKATPFNTTIFSADGLLKRQKDLIGSYFGWVLYFITMWREISIMNRNIVGCPFPMVKNSTANPLLI